MNKPHFFTVKTQLVLAALALVVGFVFFGNAQTVQAAPTCYVENSATGKVEKLPNCDPGTLQSTGFVIGSAVKPNSDECYYWTKDSTQAGATVACNLAQFVAATTITPNIANAVGSQARGNATAADLVAATIRVQQAKEQLEKAEENIQKAKATGDPAKIARAIAESKTAQDRARAAVAELKAIREALATPPTPDETTVIDTVNDTLEKIRGEEASAEAPDASEEAIADRCFKEGGNAERDAIACCDGTDSEGAVDAAKLQGCLQQNPIVQHIQNFINFLSAGVGIVVTIMIIIGGIQYLTAGGNPQQVSTAKKRIINALIALVAYAFMFAFLQWLVPGGLF